MRGPRLWSVCRCVHMRHRKPLVAASAAGSTPPVCQMAPACQLVLSSCLSHVSIHNSNRRSTG